MAAFGGLFGGVYGLAQSLVLRQWIKGSAWWILATAIGEAACFSALHWIWDFGSLADAIGIAAAGGFSLGLAQWCVLRRWVGRSAWWILAATIGKVSGAALMLFFFGRATTALFGVILALQVPLALITGIALITMVADLPKDSDSKAILGTPEAIVQQ